MELERCRRLLPADPRSAIPNPGPPDYEFGGSAAGGLLLADPRSAIAPSAPPDCESGGSTTKGCATTGCAPRGYATAGWPPTAGGVGYQTRPTSAHRSVADGPGVVGRSGRSTPASRHACSRLASGLRIRREQERKPSGESGGRSVEGFSERITDPLAPTARLRIRREHGRWQTADGHTIGWAVAPPCGGTAGLRRPGEALIRPVGQVRAQRNHLARVLASGPHQVDPPIPIPVGDEGDG